MDETIKLFADAEEAQTKASKRAISFVLPLQVWMGATNFHFTDALAVKIKCALIYGDKSSEPASRTFSYRNSRGIRELGLIFIFHLGR